MKLYDLFQLSIHLEIALEYLQTPHELKKTS